jgi:hypothetical protein
MCFIEQLWNIIKGNMETILALSTFLLATFTGAMAFFTFHLASSTKKMADEAKDASFRQIGVQTWLEMSKRFTLREILLERRNLAANLTTARRNKKEPKDYEIRSDALLLFFEEVGTLDLYGYIDNNLSEESFGFFARRWWILLESYVFEIRKKRVNTSLYINFERFAKSHSSGNSIYNEKEIQEFLNDEYSLSIP